MAKWSFYTCDLVTNRVLTDSLPFIGVSYHAKLNDVGGFSCGLPLADPAVRLSGWDFGTIPARSVIYAMRNDKCMWGGIIWTRDYDSTTTHEAFQASSFESYYMHIPFVGTEKFPATDQLRIVRQLIHDIGTLGFVLPMQPSTNTSGVFRDYEVLGFEYKWLADIIRSLQQLPNGFDYGADVYYNPGVPNPQGFYGPFAQFNLGFPRRGRDEFATPLVFEYPGNIVSFKFTEDGTEYCSDALEIGEGSGPSMKVGNFGDPSLLKDGWPIMYRVTSRKDESDLNRLNAYARGDQIIYRQPAGILELKVRGDGDPELGTYGDGDDARIRILDHRFPNGLDVFQRIESINVVVGDDGTEDITLSLINPPAVDP